MRAAWSWLFPQPESIGLSFKKVMSSAGIGQGSLEPGVHFNEPGVGTKTGQWPAHHQKARP